MNEMDEVVAEFLAESREGLDSLDRDFVSLEANPSDTETLARIFRCAHTIKGTAGFLGFSNLVSLTHAGENLLSRLREGEVSVTPEITSALLAMVDAVRHMLTVAETTGRDGDEPHATLIAEMDRLSGAPPDEPPRRTLTAGALPFVPPAMFAGSDEDVLASHAGADATRRTHTHGALEAQTGAANETIRVDVKLIDRLMDLAGELLLTRNQIGQLNARGEDALLAAASHRLNLVTAELQEGITKMRMMPLDNVFSKFPRVVRDLAQACQKQVRIEFDGRNTELDKTLIEAIKDPLTHLLRNAIDHGIELPAERVRKGKPAEGVLMVRAFHEGGQVHIHIADDGAGIQFDRVRSRALARNLVSPETLARMSDDELSSLIFLPGFSTVDAVTNLSGRGVGLDVVKTNVERIGGTVTVESRAHRGTTFAIKMPLTLAIVPALIVSSGRSRFALPQVNILEVVAYEPIRDQQKVEDFNGTSVFRLRGQLMPLVFLDRELKPADDDGSPRADGAAVPSGRVHIVVVKMAERQFGLVVDRALDQQEIVVKGLARQAKGSPIFSGATILGDGRVALILDLLALAHRARVLSDKPMGRASTNPIDPKSDTDQVSMLLLRSPDDGRMALALSHVLRLESVPQDAVHEVNDQLLWRHDEGIMPLVSVNAVIPERRVVHRNDLGAPSANALLHVVVVQKHGVSVGLIVDDIFEVVDVSMRNPRVGSRPGIAACLVIQGRVTELLDLDYVLATVDVTNVRPESLGLVVSA
jgi:two-component system chemotaxis sensor kinase CheA